VIRTQNRYDPSVVVLGSATFTYVPFAGSRRCRKTVRGVDGDVGDIGTVPDNENRSPGIGALNDATGAATNTSACAGTAAATDITSPRDTDRIA